MSELIVSRISRLVADLEPRGAESLLPPDLVPMLALVRDRGLPHLALVHLSLLSDCIRIAERIALADRRCSDEELAYLHPLVARVAPLLGRLRHTYQDFVSPSVQSSQTFLQMHAADRQPFGGACTRTEWAGFFVCRSAAQTRDGASLLRQYESIASGLIDDLSAISRAAPELQEADALRILVLEQTRIHESIDRAESTKDARIDAFRGAEGARVFHAITHATEIWKPDPFDAESIHSGAREAFERELERCEANDSAYGSILVVLGESGAGKTHLVRAFRHSVHAPARGYCAYAQLSTRSRDYARVLLRCLVDSLDHAYAEPMVSDSSITCLSEAVLGCSPTITSEEREELREAELTSNQLGRLTHGLATKLLHGQLGSVHPDVIRALLLLQRRDPALKQRVLKFLRCERLSPYEEEDLGHVTSWVDAGAPQKMLLELGRLIRDAAGGVLVFLVDQVEDLQHQDDPKQRFLELADTLRWLSDALPRSLSVLACVDDAYQEFLGGVTMAVRDRLECDPPPHRIRGRMSAENVETMIVRRLRTLYEEAGAQFDEAEPLFPFPREAIARLEGLRGRDVLQRCRDYQERCRQAGALVAFEVPSDSLPPREPQPSADPEQEVDWDTRWDAFLADWTGSDTLADQELRDRLIQGALMLPVELGGRAQAEAAEPAAALVRLGAGAAEERVLLAVNNRGPQGGHLARQLEDLQRNARESNAALVLVRSGEYPSNPRTKIVKVLGEVLKSGGKKLVVTQDELRAIGAYSGFVDAHQSQASFEAWARQRRPLSDLAVLAPLIERWAATNVVEAGGEAPSEPTQAPGEADVPPATGPKEAAKAAAGAVEAKPPRATEEGVAAPPTAAPPEGSSTIPLGITMGLRGEPLGFDGRLLAKHAAVVGATGSGKTTLALNLIEHLLLAGISVVMLDRKGDLCTYADSKFWEKTEPTAERQRRKEALRQRAELRVYTPGASAGRPLRLPLVPSGIGTVSAAERAPLALRAAEALGVTSKKERAVILSKAIALLVELDQPVTLPALAALIGSKDESLVAQVPSYRESHFDNLAEELETYRCINGHLLEGSGEELRADELVGGGDRARMTIVSTRALGSDEAVESWCARFFSEIATWAGAQSGSPLRVVLFADEADMYLPATRKPATKDALLDLLKRGRSAGLGVLLATQNPGDFDYKARGNLNSWFLGRVSQQNDIRKMRALLSEARSDLQGKLGNAGMGEFFLLEQGRVTAFKAHRSLMETKQLSEDEIQAVARASMG